MKTLQIVTVLVTVWIMSSSGHAALTIPGADGSDGTLNITTNTTIDLGLAVTGVWDTDNSGNAGKGVYDPAKWAVVFKYSSINVAAGATVTFKNHPSRAPVVWLVNGSVTIAGSVSLDGPYADPQLGTGPSEGGPGGYRGGAGPNPGPSGGFGPGGAYFEHGHYGQGQLRSYGNNQIVPLIGGSGGSATFAYRGGGGGGAILIAASGTLTLSGVISALGGTGGAFVGSGGAVRLVADQILGNGRVDAGGSSVGRTRLEATSVSELLVVTPPTQLMSADPVILWPSESAPAVRVVSISGQTTPNDPRALTENVPADVAISSPSAVSILLETTNFPTNGMVNVFVRPRNGSQATYQATLVGGTTNLATWQVQHSFIVGYSVIQARAVSP
jgi:hypothetical protein